MATEKIRCSACGFGALLFRTGESVKLTIDSAKQIQVCHRFRHEPQTSGRRAPRLDCLDFRETVQALVNNLNSGTPTSVKEAESEGSETAPAAAEEAVDKEVARSRRSRRTKVAETEAGSPKARSARRPSKKSAGGRSANSRPPTRATGAPTAP